MATAAVPVASNPNAAAARTAVSLEPVTGSDEGTEESGPGDVGVLTGAVGAVGESVDNGAQSAEAVASLVHGASVDGVDGVVDGGGVVVGDGTDKLDEGVVSGGTVEEVVESTGTEDVDELGTVVAATVDEGGEVVDGTVSCVVVGAVRQGPADNGGVTHPSGDVTVNVHATDPSTVRWKPPLNVPDTVRPSEATPVYVEPDGYWPADARTSPSKQTERASWAEA